MKVVMIISLVKIVFSQWIKKTRKFQICLFICNTPFHVILSKEIISSNISGQTCLLYISFEKSKKHNYYFNLLSERIFAGFFLRFPGHNHVSTLLGIVRLLPLLLLRFLPCQAYMGNLRLPQNRLALLFSGADVLRSFDDGIGNVRTGSSLANKDCERWYSRLILSRFLPRLLYRNVLAASVEHFTVFDGVNIVSAKPTLLKLEYPSHPVSSELKFNYFYGCGPHKILLGTVFKKNIGRDYFIKEIEFYRHVVKKYDIKYYFPHPRSQIDNIYIEELGVVFIDTVLVAEDFFSLQEKSLLFELYGTSSSMENLMSFENIKSISLGIELSNYHL